MEYWEDQRMKEWNDGKTRQAQPKVFSFALPVLQHSDTPLLQITEGVTHA
jgi:hypothetical protein